MSEIVTLELPEKLARSARELAARTRPPVESLPDDQVLALCDLQISGEQQEELSDLLARSREGQLNKAEHERLEELMLVYRRGLVRKAQALKVAVERGLRPPLN